VREEPYAVRVAFKVGRDGKVGAIDCKRIGAQVIVAGGLIDETRVAEGLASSLGDRIHDKDIGAKHVAHGNLSAAVERPRQQ
jgi:hypothetical protein